MFVLTGCDTLSYFYRKSKTAILEWVLKHKVVAVELLSDFEEYTHLSEMSEGKLKRFVQIFVFGMDVVMYVCSNLLPLTVKKQPPEVFCKKDVFKNFTIVTGKH